MRSGIKILVVDDQSSIRTALKRILKKEGYKVTTVKDGYSAIEEIKKNQFHLCFMDIKLPGIDGLDTYRVVKSYHPKMIVIIMTAYENDKRIKKALDEGCHSVIYKPFDTEKLLMIIEEIINKSISVAN